jgi:hypothetical protein
VKGEETSRSPILRPPPLARGVRSLLGRYGFIKKPGARRYLLKSAREDTNHTLSKKAKNESLKRPLKGSAGKILHLGKKEEKTEIRNISGTQKKHKIPTLEP